ncbi:Protein of unknown function [Reichenbachiella faecimaris]|uniref:DUF2568 domain-containing protein n=1 Tax=Reichenbachiella faecimaris TaxID=692418 RepID=A0A1W2GD36_REIFA|nr:YrdB family protein [Reichenbachiella faecimaris]SMD34580.1 Protein of unknown function [Reichenbachiella faecimaris]
MSTHPVNLTIRFLLELSALFSLGLWGAKSADGWIGYLLAIGLPLVSAAVWGVFAVPNDPSRSGKAPIPVSGAIRLVIEGFIFVAAIWSLLDLTLSIYAWSLGAVSLAHYILSYDRIFWLIRKES